MSLIKALQRKSVKEQMKLRKEALGPAYAFVGNESVGRIDELGLVGGPGIGGPGWGWFPPYPPVNPPSPPQPPDPCPCGIAAEYASAGIGPPTAYILLLLRAEANNETHLTGLPGWGNGPADAFRHCYMWCRLAETLGPDMALVIGDIRERCGGDFGSDASNMDYSNNQAGINFGGNCRDNCLNAAQSGNLVTLPPSEWLPPRGGFDGPFPGGSPNY